MLEAGLETSELIPGCGSYVWTLEDGIFRPDDGARELLGAPFAAASRPEAGLAGWIHPDDRDSLRDAIAAARDGGGVIAQRLTLLRADGGRVAVLHRAVLSPGTQGGGPRLSGMLALLPAEPAPPAANAPAPATVADADVFDALFHDAPLGIGIWDRNLRFVRTNDLLAAMNGLPADDHVGRTARELLPDVREIDAIETMLRGILDTGNPVRDVEVSGATPAAPDQIRHWREHFFPVRAAGRITGVAALVEDVTETQKARARADVLLHELNHRSKNLVTLILAISRQTARHQPQDFLTVFHARLEAMVAAQDLLIRQNWHEIGLGALIRSQLSHFGPLIGDRIRLTGPATALVPACWAQALALAFHELTTNAVKYGALSVDEGSLDIGWTLAEPGGAMCITWCERGGPPVEAPRHGGYGSSLTGALLEAQLQAVVTRDYAREGLTWTLDLPPTTGR